MQTMSYGNVLNKNIEFPHLLLISASAGSGKTYALAQRYAVFLLAGNDGKSLPKASENIIAVTFTNNAAKEMKQRILKYLKSLVFDDNKDIAEICAALKLTKEEVKLRAEKNILLLLNSYSSFQVQTIDSFFSGIFRLSASELNYSPDIEIKLAARQLVKSATSAVIDTAGKAGAFDAKSVDKFLDLLPKSAVFHWNPAKDLEECFFKFLDLEAKVPLDIAQLPKDKKQACSELFAETIKEYKNLLSNKDIKPEFIREKMRNPDVFKNIPDFLSAYQTGKTTFFDARKIKNWPKAAELKTFMDKKVQTLALAYARNYYLPYIQLYHFFRYKAEFIKRRLSNSISLFDISKKLASYISYETVPEIYYNLGNRLNHFMIDEFQDTSNLQWNIMLPLFEEALASRGSVFLVGDIKQAIYRFRHADYKIMSSFLYGKTEENTTYSLPTAALAHGAECENLSSNYRSGGVLVSYVDDLFKNKLKVLLASAGIEDKTGLTAYTQNAIEEKLKSGFVRCEVITEEDDYSKKIISAVQNAMQRYMLRDIAVLVRKNDMVEEIVSLLSSAGIPSASYSSLDIRKRPIIGEIFALLKFLNSPQDNISLFTFITGDIFAKVSGLAKQELMQFIAEKNKKELLYIAFRNKYPHIWSKYFEKLFKQSGYLPLYELLCLVYDTFDLFNNFCEDAAALAKLQEVISASASRGINTLTGFLDYALSEEKDDDTIKEFAVALPEELNAVNVMTWHKSKGLGFPVVINLINEGRKPNNNNMAYEYLAGSIWPVYISKTTRFSPELSAKYNEDKLEEFIQLLNTLYVICTRAKDELYNIVINTAKPKKAAESAESLPNPLDIFETCECGQVDSAKVPENKDSYSNGIKPRYKGRDITLNEPPAKLPEDNRNKRLRGEFIHAIISEYRLDPKLSINSNIEKIYDRIKGLYACELDKESTVKMLAGFIISNKAKDFFTNSAREVLCEAEFIDDKGQLIRLDRVLFFDDEIWVVDFKTGLINSDYSKQIKHYMQALRQIYTKPIRGLLAYVEINEVEEVQG